MSCISSLNLCYVKYNIRNNNLSIVIVLLKNTLRQTAVENRLTELGETKNAEQVTVEAKNGKLTTQQSANAQTE